MLDKRIIAIDFGLKNIGLAISVPETTLSAPLRTVPRKAIWQEISAIMKEYNITQIVIGIPLRTDGKEDEIVVKIKEFATEVQDKFQIPVKLWDESLSTHNAEAILKMNRHPYKSGRRHKKEPIDHFSAALILEEYLECNDR